MRITDHCFTSTAPVFGSDEDEFDPFYQPADRAATPSPQAKALASVPFEGRAPVETMNG